MIRKKSLQLINLGLRPKPPLDDLYVCLRPILKFGQLTGICPYRGLWSRHPDTFPTCRLTSVMMIPSMVIICLMIVNVVMNLIGMARKIMSGQSSPIQISWAIQMPLFYSAGLYTYIHFIRHGESLCSLFTNWRGNCRQMRYAGDEERRLRWKIRFWSTIIMTSAILENVVYHMRIDCNQTNCRHVGEKNHTSLEDYYLREHSENWVRVPYQPVVAMLLFVINKLAVISTNFADISIITVAWVMSSKFQQLIFQLNSEIVSKIFWNQVRKDFAGLHKVFQGVNSFLSPTIFMSYTLLLELISTQIHLGITTDTNRPTMDKIYSAWSFLHLIVRLVLLSVISSRIEECCQDILFLVQKCPPEKYDNEVERLERLVSSPMCLTGLGCFRLSKSFILTIIHVIFTCEIIFLQTAPLVVKSSQNGTYYN